MTKPVRLGEVTCPSGELVIVDGGYLRLWSADQSPMTIDSEILGREPDLSVDGDIPHRELVRQVGQSGGGEFWMCGVPAIAVAGLPAGKLLDVLGDPVQDGWGSIRIVVSDAPVAESRTLGEIGIDWARIAVADADALSAWRHDEPIDGRADVAFWGAAEDEAAEAFGAPLLDIPGEEGVHGWMDLSVDEASLRAAELVAWRDMHAVRRLMVDFRPHSHHWQVMRGVRASSTDSGMVEVGGAWLLFAMTSWGDGYFPVVLDVDASGALVDIRIILADDPPPDDDAD